MKVIVMLGSQYGFNSDQTRDAAEPLDMRYTRSEYITLGIRSFYGLRSFKRYAAAASMISCQSSTITYATICNHNSVR